MKLVGSVAAAVLPIYLFGCGSGFLDEDAADDGSTDGVEQDRALEATELWGVAVAGRTCKPNKDSRFKHVKTLLQCQQWALDAGVDYFSYREKRGGKKRKCLVTAKCSLEVAPNGGTTYMKPVPGHSECTCPATTTSTTTTTTNAPWTHVVVDEFEDWAVKHGLNFDPAEAAWRLKIFKENTKAVEEHNKKGHKWWKVQNKFTHLLQSEFEELLTYDESQSIENSDVPVFNGKSDDAGPQRRLTARDWSVSPVKDQGSCGSCWAFAAVAGMEAAARVHLSRSDLLSEQQVCDCTSSTACSGGNSQSAYPALVGDALYTGSSYPYLERNDVCHTGVDSGLRITAYVKSVPSAATDAQMVAGLNANPLVVTVDASSWGGYGGGVHSCPTSTCSINHAVLATGYDATYFKLKNSWSSSWGEDGYIRVARTAGGCGADGTSAVLKHGAFYPVMETTSTTTLPAYFLAAGHATCDEACDGAGQECDLAALAAAATNIDVCAGILTGLGKSFGPRLTHQDDNSGCTYHPDQSGWAQLYRANNQNPTCAQRNSDPSRQRVCACKPKFFLAQGGQSCTAACQAMPSGPKTCHRPSLIYAAVDQNKCKSLIQEFGGKSTINIGTYEDDKSGCTYHPDNGGWAQVFRKNSDYPECDEVNSDQNRQRLCACI